MKRQDRRGTSYRRLINGGRGLTAAVLVAAVLMGTSSGVASASTSSAAVSSDPISTFYAGINDPQSITVGPDGAMWFVNHVSSTIGRITTSGKITLYKSLGEAIDQPDGITSGPDGALWFTNAGNNTIGRITTGGTVTDFSSPKISVPSGITSGPDHEVWFTNTGGGGVGSIGRITTSGVVTDFAGSGIDRPTDIISGPGGLWFANATSSVGRITTTGAVTLYPTPVIYQGTNEGGHPVSLAVGPGGGVWFTADVHNAQTNPRNLGSLGEITASGEVVYHPTGAPGEVPLAVTAGPNDSMWVTQAYSGFPIVEVSMSGAVTNYASEQALPSSIVAGPDGALWVTYDQVALGAGGDPEGANSIGRLTPAGAMSTYTTKTLINYSPWLGAGKTGMYFSNASTTEPTGFINTEGDITDLPGVDLGSMALAPDGTLWTVGADGDNVEHETARGAVLQTFTNSLIFDAGSIVFGPDGALWFLNTCPLNVDGPRQADTRLTSSGSDGVAATACVPRIGRVTTSGQFTFFDLGRLSQPADLLFGSDGALWFENSAADAIDRMTTTGQITAFPAPGGVSTVLDSDGMTTGPDGAIWFTTEAAPGDIKGYIYKLTTSGVFTAYTSPTAVDYPTAITAGPDGALWFNNSNDTIGRMTSDGTFTTYQAPAVRPQQTLFDIASGPDDTVWFTTSDSGIGKISVP